MKYNILFSLSEISLELFITMLTILIIKIIQKNYHLMTNWWNTITFSHSKSIYRVQKTQYQPSDLPRIL